MGEGEGAGGGPGLRVAGHLTFRRPRFIARRVPESVSDVIEGLHAVTIHIRDIGAARKFYREVLGLDEVSFNEKMNRAVFALPGTKTLLTMHPQAPGEEGREPGTVSGVVFHHHDPAAACARIRERGGTISSEPALVELPGAKFYRAAIADPDGNEFVLSSRVD